MIASPLAPPTASRVYAARRLRGTAWAITQTALATGLAWFLTRDVLGHLVPFFAPIAAAVCLWATNVVRAKLAIELMIGVATGIGVGTGVHAVLGTDPVAMALAVLLALSVAVLIGKGLHEQRPMFVNQAVISAILTLTFPERGVVLERLFDALIGGGVAVAFSILIFPKNPLTVLRGAHRDVLVALPATLAQISRRAGDAALSKAGRTTTTAVRLRPALARLTEARDTARQLARFCPRRWPLRGATRTADQRAERLALLGGSVLDLGRAVTGATASLGLIAEPLRAAIRNLTAAGAALADEKQSAITEHAESARRHTAAFQSADPAFTQLLLAAVIDRCADELQQLAAVALW